MEYLIPSGQNRITPVRLSEHDALIEFLALRWYVADLSPEWFWEGGRLPEPMSYIYIDFRHHVGTLLLTTQCPDATRLIFMLVLNQAIALNKTSFWVENELKFEGMIYGADRADFLRLALDETARSHGGQLSDAVLDEFNERTVRFALPTL